MPRTTTRRHFLQTAMTAGAALGLGELTKLLPLSPATADEIKVTPDLVRFSPDIEPIVRLIEETPRENCVSMMIEQLKHPLFRAGYRLLPMASDQVSNRSSRES